MAARTVLDDTIRHLMASLLLLKPGLRDFDETRSVDENVAITGVELQFVRSYVAGRNATSARADSTAQVDRDTAEKLIACYERVGVPLNDADEIIRKTISDAEERSALLRPIGEMYADIWFQLMLPVVRKHPDLDPDGDRFRRKEQ
jgi:hypothetical protein